VEEEFERGDDMTHALLAIPDVAKMWNVSPSAVKDAAERAGLLVRIGRAVKIYEDDLERLVRTCQGQAKAHDYTGASQPKPAQDNGLSSTARQSAKQAAQTVGKLTKRLQTTSIQEASNVTPLRQKHT
jgi:hypothetical protein